MKPIKIIDLLNKIANGEEIPEKIRFEGKIFEKQDETSFYCTGFGIFEEAFVLEDLNKEVEIIEEESKPITKESIEALGYACGEIQKCFTNGWNKSLENKSLKEDKEIEKLELCMKYHYKDNFDNIEKDIHTLVVKINKLIDKVNSLENKQ